MADRLPSGRGGTAAAALVAALVADLLSQGTALSRAGSGALAAPTAAAPRTCRWVDTASENECVPQSAELSASETARRAVTAHRFASQRPDGSHGPHHCSRLCCCLFRIQLGLLISIQLPAADSFHCLRCRAQRPGLAACTQAAAAGPCTAWQMQQVARCRQRSKAHRQQLQGFSPPDPDRCSSSLPPAWKGWWHAQTQRLQPLHISTEVASSCWRTASPILLVAGVIPAGLPCGKVKVVHITLWTSAAERVAKHVRLSKVERLAHESSAGNSKT